MWLGEFWRKGACVRLLNALRSVNSDPAERVRARSWRRSSGLQVLRAGRCAWCWPQAPEPARGLCVSAASSLLGTGQNLVVMSLMGFLGSWFVSRLFP